MISEEEKERIEASMTCDSCLCWHKYCKAECCKIIYLNIKRSLLKEKGKYLYIRNIINKDEQHYYKLHGISYIHGVLKIPKDNVVEIDKDIIYYRPCDYLQEDLTCKGYPNNRPKKCIDFTEEDVTAKGKARLTPNCLFKYKKMVKEYGKEE